MVGKAKGWFARLMDLMKNFGFFLALLSIRNYCTCGKKRQNTDGDALLTEMLCQCSQMGHEIVGDKSSFP